MGIYEAEATVLSGHQGIAALSRSDDIPDWLDGLLAPLNLEPATSRHTELVRSRLKNLPFGEILATIERNRPHAGAGRGNRTVSALD